MKVQVTFSAFQLTSVVFVPFLNVSMPRVPQFVVSFGLDSLRFLRPVTLFILKIGL